MGCRMRFRRTFPCAWLCSLVALGSGCGAASDPVPSETGAGGAADGGTGGAGGDIGFGGMLTTGSSGDGSAMSPLGECGDGKVDPKEECDDANTKASDG